jgi:hypothetical protein
VKGHCGENQRPLSEDLPGCRSLDGHDPNPQCNLKWDASMPTPER